MKTSIIISTVAAVCLMINIAESPMNGDNQFNIETLYNTISHSITSKPDAILSANAKADGPAIPYVALTENFDYLKFDVADYTLANEAAEENNEKSFAYLKFNVSTYSTAEDNESIEMPVNEFDYLKFHINSYTTTGNNEAMESPVNDFDYLKFDLNAYTTTDNDESMELPVNEFDYLKFDVTKYSSDALGSGQNVELPFAGR